MPFNIKLKDGLFLVITFLFFSLTQAQIVNIPDANFKNALVNTNCVDSDANGIGNFDADTNNDGEIQVSEAEAVTHLIVANNNITSLEGIQSFTNMQSLNCMQNQISSLNVSELVNLTYLNCMNQSLSALDVSGLFNLTILNCRWNNLTSLDVSDLVSLEMLSCDGNEINSLDLSSLRYLESLNCYNNQLTTLVLKNGSVLNTMSIHSNPNLLYICVDEEEYSAVLAEVVENSLPSVVNTYCSFIPGGDYYTAEGQVRLDLDSNGCDTEDIFFPNLRFNVTDTNQNINRVYFSDYIGTFYIPFQEGTYNLTPVFNNSEYFSINPINLSLDFPTDSSPFNQDFCVTQNGIYNDLEIIIVPLQPARPGFDTDYKVVYWNKGNTTLSGTVYFDFNEPAGAMSFVSSTPIHETLEDNLLSWNYSNLQPFETREILVTLNMNSPMDNPPLNGGDDIGFVADIYPKDIDETSNDNNFQLKETVVNSFDPNDKTCLEGETITPEQVGKYLHYLIRFENTGTASAVNIVVKDIIDTNSLDISTLVPLHSSHDFWTRINDNVVEFIFEDINLPFDDANNDGYIAFKIKTLDTLVLDDTIDNNAEIYFDYNFPIITNTSQVIVATLSSEDFEFNSIHLYPNPTKNILNIKVTNTVESIEIYNLLGQQIYNKVSNSITEEIDISNYNSGMYLVKVTIEEQTATYKVIKE